MISKDKPGWHDVGGVAWRWGVTRRPQKKANQGGMTGAWLGGKMWQNGLIKKIKLKKEKIM